MILTASLARCSNPTVWVSIDIYQAIIH